MIIRPKYFINAVIDMTLSYCRLRGLVYKNEVWRKFISTLFHSLEHSEQDTLEIHLNCDGCERVCLVPHHLVKLSN